MEQTKKTTATKRIIVKKVVKQIGKITTKIKTIKGLVVQYYYCGGTNINIKLKIAD